MPTPYVKKMADKHNMSVEDAEKLWDKAKKQATDQGHKEDFDYITSIFKKMIGEDISIKSLKEFIEEESTAATTTTGPGIAMRDTVLGQPAYKVSHDAYVKLLQGKKKGRRWKEIVDDLDLTQELKKRLYNKKTTYVTCEQYPEACIELRFK